MADEVDPQQLAEQLLAQAKAQGVDLVGPDGLVNRLTRNVLETALEAEMTSIWATSGTTWPGGAAGTDATAPGPRRC